MRINIGGQQTRDRFPPGWICVDILPAADVHCDISTDTLPFQTSTVHAIYCSHVLEHIWPWRLDFTISEFYRVLIPQGRIRIVVPDMDIAIDEYLRNRSEPHSLSNCMKWWFDPSLDGQGKLYLNHVNGFNKPDMIELLSRHGFYAIEVLKYCDCYPVFTGCDNPGHKNTSLYVEAKK